MIKGKIFFVTPAGNEWLEHEFEMHRWGSAEMIMREWYRVNAPTAARLVEGWLRNGESEEEAQLWACAACDDKVVERQMLSFLEALESE